MNNQVEVLDIAYNLLSMRQMQAIEERCRENIKLKELNVLPHTQKKLEAIKNVKVEARKVDQSLFETEKQTVVEVYYKDQMQIQHHRVQTDQQLKTTVLLNQAKELQSVLGTVDGAVQNEENAVKLQSGSLRREIDLVTKRVETTIQINQETEAEISKLRELLKERKKEVIKTKQSLIQQLVSAGLTAEMKEARYKQMKQEKIALISGSQQVSEGALTSRRESKKKLPVLRSKVTFSLASEVFKTQEPIEPSDQLQLVLSKHKSAYAKLEPTNQILFGGDDEKLLKQVLQGRSKLAKHKSQVQ